MKCSVLTFRALLGMACCSVCSAATDQPVLTADFQKLRAVGTASGLWLESVESGGGTMTVTARAAGARTFDATGTLTRSGEVVQFSRPGVIEEYRTGVDGIRQDFYLPDPPVERGIATLSLQVTGARAAAASFGALFTLEGSGRELAYSRLRVTDADGQVLTAQMEVPDAQTIVISFNDRAARYPVRVDPTYSDADWVALNPQLPGTNGDVTCMVADGGNLYIGGSFTAIHNTAANGLAKWNGSTWSAAGLGAGSIVNAIHPDGSGGLYIAGLPVFPGSSVNSKVARWNGSTWSNLGSGITGTVNALAMLGTDVCAGGSFTTAGGNPANRIAKWNGSTWSALGSGMDAAVQSLVVMGGDLYAGGYFATAGSVTAGGVARWNGSAWSAVGTDSGSWVNQWVNVLTTDGTSLYAGGNFFNLGSTSVTRIAKWNGSAWSGLGTGITGEVRSILINGSDVFAAGGITKAGGVNAWGVAKWNGTAWSALGAGLSDTFTSSRTGYALAMKDGVLYAGGNFNAAGTVIANGIAAWSSSTWSALGAGLNGYINTVAVSGSDLYVGGKFTSIGSVAASSIAKWNGSAWSALRAAAGAYGEGFPLGGEVNAIAVSGTDVYAGGRFSYAGGPITVNHIAKWNGTAWSALGSGVEGQDSGGFGTAVRALAISGTNVFAGGTFKTAGGSAANHIARWDTVSGTWSPLADGYAAYVNAMAVIGTDLYAGGSPVTITGFSNMSKWNGTAWSLLPLAGDVYTLAVNGTDVYAGGNFAIGGSRKRIARWNGTAWSDIGSGIGTDTSIVNAIAFKGTEMVAAGLFSTAGGTAANNIAVWDGAAWAAAGSGTDGNIRALAVAGSDIITGGEFTTAGTKFSPFLAKLAAGGSSVPAFTAWQQTNFGAGAADPAIAGAGADPDHDCIPNLIEFAMNLNPVENVRVFLDPAAGTSGLPDVRRVTTPSGTVLRLTYLRRKASTNPGITYQPQFSPALSGWTNAAGAETVVSVDATWERVTIDDTVTGALERFGRVLVTQVGSL